MTVRRAGPADAREIADVHVRTWQAAYRHAFPPEVFDNLSVDQRERSWRARLEEELMSAAKDWFTQEGYSTAMLWVLADNPRARRFYEREGWRAEGTRIDTVRGVDVEEALYRLTLVGG